MAAAENKGVVRRLIEAIWNQGDLTVMERFFAPEFINHNPNHPAVNDRAGFAEWVMATGAAFPDLRMTIDDIAGDGDEVFVRWTLRGTHCGFLDGLAPTGRCVCFTGVTVYRLAGRQVVEAWWTMDTLSLLGQLGAELSVNG